jgi:hypothetical protein
VNYYAGIDVSLELSSVCIVDATGEIVKEAKVEAHPDALVKFFKAFGLPLTVIGLEAGPLSQWLYAGLTKAGFVTSLKVCLKRLANCCEASFATNMGRAKCSSRSEPVWRIRQVGICPGASSLARMSLVGGLRP